MESLLFHFMLYFTTPSVDQNVERGIVGWKGDNELERTAKEIVVVVINPAFI
jgi:hypothetical protein